MFFIRNTQRYIKYIQKAINVDGLKFIMYKFNIYEYPSSALPKYTQQFGSTTLNLISGKIIFRFVKKEPFTSFSFNKFFA